MEFLVLGSVELLDDGRQVAVRSGKLAELLAVLLLQRNEVASTDSLIDALWGDDPPATALKTLQLYVSQLRRLLPAETLQTRRPGYVLVVDSGSLDSERFEQLLAAGRHALDVGDAEAAAGILREALSLWRGPALADFRYASFAQHEIERLEELRLEALEERLAADLARGRHAEVVNEAEALVREHPLRERLRAEAMLALYRCGRQSEALAVYREGRRLLDEELGIEPGPELRELEQAILRHDESVAAPLPAPAVIAPVRRSRKLMRVGAAVVAVTVIAAAIVAALLTRNASGHRLGAGVVRIDARTGSVTRPVDLKAGPGQTAAGDGAIWTSNTVDGTVSRVDPDTGQVDTIHVGLKPAGLAVDAKAVWVADGEANTLDRVDPAFANTTPIPVGNAPAGVAISHDSVWVANTADGTVTRVSESSGKPSKPIPVGPGPLAVAADRSAVWVTLSGAGAVVRIDPRTAQFVDEVNVGRDPSALVAGHGALWVANTDDGTVSRIDTAIDKVTETRSVGSRPVALTEAAGKLWVALAGGSLVRLDPTSLEPAGTPLQLGSTPTGLATLGGAVWMTALPPAISHRGGTLRVDVPSFNPCRCMDPAVDLDPFVSWNFLDLAYDGLVAYRRVGGPSGNALVGDLAESVPRPTDRGRTYVFRVRPGVRFSTGAPVRPTDVRHSFERLLRILERVGPAGLPPWRNYIVGADRCTASHCDLSTGIAADDASGTVTPEPTTSALAPV
jgi:YVTN family beta-propeller protein